MAGDERDTREQNTEEEDKRGREKEKKRRRSEQGEQNNNTERYPPDRVIGGRCPDGTVTVVRAAANPFRDGWGYQVMDNKCLRMTTIICLIYKELIMSSGRTP